MKQFFKKISKCFLFALPLILIGVSAYAGGASTTGLAGLANNVTKSIGAFGELLISISYLAGIGFMVAAIFKFKQHKDNPTQVTVGTPIAMLFIGIGLVFLPYIVTQAGTTIIGKTPTSGQAGGFTGNTSGLPGGVTP